MGVLSNKDRWAKLFAGIDHKTMEFFKMYHNENPTIYSAFVEYALEAAKKYKQYSAKSIMERVRWEVEIAGGKEFKINNDFTSLYARLFVYNYPGLETFFEFRTLTGLRRVA